MLFKSNLFNSVLNSFKSFKHVRHSQSSATVPVFLPKTPEWPDGDVLWLSAEENNYELDFVHRDRSEPRLDHDHLKELLQLTDEDVEKNFKYYPQLSDITTNHAITTIDSLRNINIDIEALQLHPWLLLRSPSFIRLRTNQLNYFQATRELDLATVPIEHFGPLIGAFRWPFIQKNLEYRIRIDTIPTTSWNIKKAINFLESFYERTDLISRELEMTRWSVIRSVIKQKSTHAFTKRFDSLELLIHFLRYETNIPLEYIQSNLSLFKQNHKTMKIKYQTAQDSQISFNPSFFRMSKKNFATRLDLIRADIEALDGSPDLSAWLQNNLYITADELLAMQFNNRSLMAMKPRRVIEVIKFIISCGYSSTDLVQNPTILSYNLDDIKKRYEVMKSRQAEVYIPDLLKKASFYHATPIVADFSSQSPEQSLSESTEEYKMPLSNKIT